jgi:ABC-2 type transport system ATP-binding protein
LIEIDQLRLSLGGVAILHDVRLSLDQGEIYGLLGPNRAGKSTTIAAALGLLRPDAGRIRLLGRDPCAGAHELCDRVGVLSERNGFYDWKSAEGYLAFFAGLHGSRLTGNETRRRLAVVGMKPCTRSGSAATRAACASASGLACALVCAPKLLILDEPTNGSIRAVGARSTTSSSSSPDAVVGILLCTHLLDDVDRLCRRVGIIAGGRTIAEGAIADLLRTRSDSPVFRLRLAGDAPAADEGSAAQGGHGERAGAGPDDRDRLADAPDPGRDLPGGRERGQPRRHRPHAEPFVDFSVRRKPIVESQRVLPVAFGLPLLIGGAMVWRRNRA